MPEARTRQTVSGLSRLGHTGWHRSRWENRRASVGAIQAPHRVEFCRTTGRPIPRRRRGTLPLALASSGWRSSCRGLCWIGSRRHCHSVRPCDERRQCRADPMGEPSRVVGKLRPGEQAEYLGSETPCAHDRRHLLTLLAGAGAAIHLPRRRCRRGSSKGRPASGVPGNDPSRSRHRVCLARPRSVVVPARRHAGDPKFGLTANESSHLVAVG